MTAEEQWALRLLIDEARQATRIINPELSARLGEAYESLLEPEDIARRDRMRARLEASRAYAAACPGGAS